MSQDMTLNELPTPSAVVDLDRMAANLDRMAAYAHSHGLALRPHIKTHKIPELGAEQVGRGAAGLTVATPREAEVMSVVARDLLVAYPPVGRQRLERLLELPPELSLSIALDSPEALLALAEGATQARRGVVGVLVELDMGLGRCGVRDPESAVRLARAAAELEGVRFLGVMFYPGHIRDHVDAQGPALERLSRELALFIDALAGAGLAPEVVSGGSTPTAFASHRVPELTEIRPGTYVFNDRTTTAIGACAWEDCAYTVLATVISTAAGRAVVDAGSKALSREDLRSDDGSGFGVLLGRPDVTVGALTEEHGVLDLSRTGWRPPVGSRVRIIPNHVCVSVNLQDRLWGVHGETVALSFPVSARGREPLALGPVAA